MYPAIISFAALVMRQTLEKCFSPIGVSYWQTRTSKTPLPTSYSGPAKQLFLQSRWLKRRKIRFWSFVKFWDCLLIFAKQPSKLEFVTLNVWKMFSFGIDKNFLQKDSFLWGPSISKWQDFDDKTFFCKNVERRFLKDICNTEDE